MDKPQEIIQIEDEHDMNFDQPDERVSEDSESQINFEDNEIMSPTANHSEYTLRK